MKNQRDHEKAILPHPRSAQYLRVPRKQFPISKNSKNMQTPKTSIRIVSASSPEGKRLLAQVNEFGEPLWREKWYAHLRENGVRKSQPPPQDANHSFMKT